MVEIKNLTKHEDDRGYLCELLRKDDKLFDGEFGQVLVSVLKKGVRKGLHLHRKQTDYTTCIKGRINYYVEGMMVTMTPDNLILIKVPPGEWHGYEALEDSILIHIMDKTYDPTDTEVKEW